MVADGHELRERLTALAIAGAILCAGLGCAKPIYHWGEYEDLVYQMYAKPGKADPATQIAKLTEDLEKSEAEGGRVPPGVHAHLGFLYYTQGQLDLAADQFATEKQLFPESATFIDGILDRMTLQ